MQQTEVLSTFCLADQKQTQQKLSSLSSMFMYKMASKTYQSAYGHITLKAPVLVRSPKLSNVEPG